MLIQQSSTTVTVLLSYYSSKVFFLCHYIRKKTKTKKELKYTSCHHVSAIHLFPTENSCCLLAPQLHPPLLLFSNKNSNSVNPKKKVTKVFWGLKNSSIHVCGRKTQRSMCVLLDHTFSLPYYLLCHQCCCENILQNLSTNTFLKICPIF